MWIITSLLNYIRGDGANDFAIQIDHGTDPSPTLLGMPIEILILISHYVGCMYKPALGMVCKRLYVASREVHHVEWCHREHYIVRDTDTLYLPFVKWMINNGCALREYNCRCFIQRGDLDVVILLKEKGAPWNSKMCRVASECGMKHIIEWMMKHDADYCKRSVVLGAISTGRLDILEMIGDDGIKVDRYDYCTPMKTGNIEILDWLQSHGCVPPDGMDEYAAINNQLESLKWLKRNGYKCGELVSLNAVKNGNLDMLKWAIENGCGWHEQVVMYCAWFGQLETLQWALENGCPNRDNMVGSAAQGGHLETLKWLVENGYAGPLDLFASAGLTGHSHIKLWINSYLEELKKSSNCRGMSFFLK